MAQRDPRFAPLRDALAGQVLRGSGGVDYHLRERIGEGGQGWVFKANWDDPGGLVVIVKVLRPDAVHGEALRRFQREAEVLRLLSQQSRPNPHIVRFFDHAVAKIPLAGETLALPFTVLEYVNGPTLEQVLKPQRGRGLPVERARRLTRQVVLALEVVHAQKVVHRDLKPSNILLANDAGTEVAKVTDFGLVKVIDVSLQRTTALAGASLGYAPPEQYEQGNQRVSPRTDVFSLAAILFEMLSGHPAFPYREGENPLLIVTRILNGPRPSLARARESLCQELAAKPDVIEALDAQFARALSPDPADRHESLTEFWQKVEPVLRSANETRGGLTPYPSQLPLVEPSHPIMPIERRPISGVPMRPSPMPASNPVSTPPRFSGTPPPRTLTPDSVASNPAAWTWTIVARPVQAGAVRAAIFAASGEYAVAVGPAGLARLERDAWVQMGAPTAIDPRLVRGLKWVGGTDLLVYGGQALAARLTSAGTCDLLPVPDRELTFHGALTEDDGTTTLVGERPMHHAARGATANTIGALVQLKDGRLTLASDASSCTRLRGVTRLRDGRLLGCGDWGTLVRVELGVVEHVGSICGGHLSSISAMDDGGAVTVGVGGHALHITPRLDAQLEAVQTTRDLLSLAIGDDGAAWAGAAQSRLLRRTGGAWVRMSGDVGIHSGIVAVWASSRFVRAVCDDGAVLEGRLV